MAPERPSTPADIQGRMAKADEFALAASVLFDDAREQSGQPDAYVAMAVLAGIAAADVICMRALGVRHTGQDHAAAAKLLARVDRGAAQALTRLLSDKSKAEYSAGPPSSTEVRAARRDHLRLVELARASL